MQLGQRRQAMLQLHMSDQQFYYLLRCALYKRFDGNNYPMCLCLLRPFFNPHAMYTHSCLSISEKSWFFSSDQFKHVLNKLFVDNFSSFHDN